uniref:Tektin n=1 Tax=Thelazia callipaeda TaxID=103827 RepID=A0A0N5DAS7_THECL
LEITRQRNLIDQAKTLIDHNTAKENLHRIQSDCVDLCCYWLNELICMQILQDKCAQILHQLMVGNCHWFLAQYGHLSKPY